MSEILRLEDLAHHYGEKKIFSNLNLHLKQGEFVSLLGESGCGKTSVLRAIAGLLTPVSGKIFLGGHLVYGPKHFISPQERPIGLVFQDYALFPHLSVFQNIAFGLHGQSSEAIEQRCSELLAITELRDHADKKPSQLSGGQQQRVALARALAPKPELLLLDEPFANIDASLKLSLGQAIKNILMQESATVLLVTHDRHDALSLSDRIAIMSQTESGGFIQQIGNPEVIYRRALSPDAARLTGETLVFDGTSKGKWVDTPYGRFESMVEINGEVRIIERPENLGFYLDPTGPFSIQNIYFYGGTRKASLITDNGQWVANCPPDATKGDRLSMKALRALWTVPRN